MSSAVLLNRPSGISNSVESLYALIGNLLGFKVQTEVDLLERLEKGVTIATIHHLQEKASLTDAETFGLIAPRRTLSRREASGQPLTAEEGDRTFRIARVIARAQQVFAGQPQYVAQWLREPKTHLGNRAPLQALATESGAHAVEEMLVGIDFGMFT